MLELLCLTLFVAMASDSKTPEPVRMKTGVVRAKLLGSRGSLRAKDYLCSTVDLRSAITKLEEQRGRIDAELRRMRSELLERERLERIAAAEGLVLPVSVK